MGFLSFRYKTHILGLLKCLNSMNYYIIFFSLINLSVCIYEDQIGKFDWRQTYVGRIKFSQFDTVSTAKKIIVATEENVLAALNLKTGQVVWRHVLESASSGNIQFLHVGERVFTVSGANPFLVRGWDTASGVLLWEWSLTLHNFENAEFSEWWVHQGMLVHLVPVSGSHLEITMYNMITGHSKGTTVQRLGSAWKSEACTVAPPYYTCISESETNQLLLSVDVTSSAAHSISRPLSNYVNPEGIVGVLRHFDGNSVIPGFIIDDKIIGFKDNDYDVMKIALADPDASVIVVDTATGPVVLQTWYDDDRGFFLTAHDLATSEEISDLRVSDRHSSVTSRPQFLSTVCTKSAREQYVCRLLVAAADDSVHLLQQGGRVFWTREEALANVVAVEFVDLPVSDLEAAIESEFDQKEGSLWGAFSRRIQTQAAQLSALLRGWSGRETTGDSGQRAPLVRDYFNLHKIIVLVTDVGKIFGMDNLSGSILWRHFEPNLDAAGAVVYTRRSARHPPHDAHVTIVGRHHDTGNGLIVSLNPITGKLIGERSLHLDCRLQQSALLHKADPEHLRALILLDVDDNVQILPISAAPLVQDMYMYVAERRTAEVRGYALRYDGRTVNAVPTWSMRLGGDGGGGGSRLVRALGKAPRERVHSPGRVLGDRSVLYKYLNPNLVLFITEAPDPIHKEVVTAWLVDVVSGAVVWAQVHRRARATTHAVHTEHMIAYAYFNDKQRRTEIASLELYTGKERWQSGGSWEALGGLAPRVERQAYVAPAALAAAAATITQRALTDKHVLMALTSGAIVELPWAYLEPRRGLAAAGGPGGAEAREEGVLPYTPELPLPADAVINYNNTLGRVGALHAAPAGIESTCLVLATGLDLFYTRVAPSKTFDLLKEDFDYYLIGAVLVALVVATYSTKYFAARKTLKQAWK